MGRRSPQFDMSLFLVVIGQVKQIVLCSTPTRYIIRLHLLPYTLKPSHYLNQCSNIVNWIPTSKLQWNSCIFIQENTFKNVVCQIVATLSRPQCVNARWGDHIDDISEVIQYSIIRLHHVSQFAAYVPSLCISIEPPLSITLGWPR